MKLLTDGKLFLTKKEWDIKTLIYCNIIFWPLIFACSELIGFPSVILMLIILSLMMVYLARYDIRKFKFALIYFVLIPLALQFVILYTLNFKFNFNLDRTVNLLKFNIRWMHLILILYVFSENKVMEDLYLYSKRLVNKIFIASSIFVFIEACFLFTSKGYENIWDGSYFKGPFFNPHVNSYFLIVPMISLGFCYFNLQDKRYKIICIILSTVTIALNLLTGARTPSVVALVLYFILFFSKVLKNKKLWISVPLGIVIILLLNSVTNILDLTNIPLVKKTMMVLNNPYGFLNGRNFIWESILKNQYEHFNIVNYLFGMGLGESMQVNYAYIRQYLWCHNDLLETFNGLGIYGLVVYFFCCYKYFFKNKYFISAVAFFILLFFNGLFIYSELANFIPFVTMVYTYQLKVESLGFSLSRG